MTRKPKAYVPQRGDIVWIHLDPQAGREQAGHRTCLVLSPALYNGKTGLAVLCPITNQAKGYPFEVPLPTGIITTGVILADHTRASIGESGRRSSARRSLGMSCKRCWIRRLACWQPTILRKTTKNLS